MLARPLVSMTYKQRFWEFFIFGFVFVALFLFWLIIGAGIVIGYVTGGLAGLCFTAAWFSWFLDARVAGQRKAGEETILPVVQSEVPAAAPVDEREETAKEVEKPAEGGAVETVETPVEKQAIVAPPLVEAVATAEPKQEQVGGLVDEHPESSAHALPVVTLPDADPAKMPALEAYCVKCHRKRPMSNSRLVELKSGHPALRATCPVCGTGMFRIISLKQEKDWQS